MTDTSLNAYATSNGSKIGIPKKRRQHKQSSNNSSQKKKKLRRTLQSPMGILLPKKSKSRRVTKSRGLDIPTPDEHIMVIDSACDQSMVHVGGFLILVIFSKLREQCME